LAELRTAITSASGQLLAELEGRSPSLQSVVVRQAVSKPSVVTVSVRPFPDVHPRQPIRNRSFEASPGPVDKLLDDVIHVKQYRLRDGRLSALAVGWL